MKINPNPKCRSCVHYNDVFIDGYSGLVGHHYLCIIPRESMEGYTALGYDDEFVIDDFYNGHRECKFYEEDLNG